MIASSHDTVQKSKERVSVHTWRGTERDTYEKREPSTPIAEARPSLQRDDRHKTSSTTQVSHPFPRTTRRYAHTRPLRHTSGLEGVEMRRQLGQPILLNHRKVPHKPLCRLDDLVVNDESLRRHPRKEYRARVDVEDLFNKTKR